MHVILDDRDKSELEGKIQENTEAVSGLKSGIGDLKTLTTDDKSNVVSAINECFQFASNGKSLLSTALFGRGQNVESNATFQEFADAINNISDSNDDISLNVHFGYTQPENTNCLWVKSEELNNAYIINQFKKPELESNMAEIDVSIEINDSFTVIDEKIYIIGGYCNGFLSDIRCFDTVTRETNIVADLGDALNASLVSHVGDNIYIFGGWSGTRGVLSNRIYCFNTIDKTVRTLDSMITARENGSAVAVGDKIYIVGGFGNDNTNLPIEIFDSSTETVETLSIEFSYGQGSRAILNDKYIYIVCGWSKGSNYSGTDNVYILNTIDNSFVSNNLKLVHDGQKKSINMIGDILYVFGGYYFGAKKYIDWVNINTGEKGSLEEGLSNPLFSMAVAKVNETLFIIGGMYDKGLTTNSVHLYNRAIELAPNSLVIKTSDNESYAVQFLLPFSNGHISVNVDSMYKIDANSNKILLETLVYKDDTWINITDL